MRAISLGITMIALWVASVGVTSSAESFNQDRIVDVANRYISNKWPSFDLRKRKPSVVDLGARCQVSYPLPEGLQGGGPVVIIDKKTLKVIEAFHEQ